MTISEMNAKLAYTLITICPWDSAWTNQATATVLSVGAGRIVRYQVDGCDATICRQVSYGTWAIIIAQL